MHLKTGGILVRVRLPIKGALKNKACLCSLEISDKGVGKGVLSCGQIKFKKSDFQKCFNLFYGDIV